MAPGSDSVFSVGRGDGAEEAGGLLRGNRSFVEDRVREDPDAFQRLARGQAPPFLLVGCCDSREPLDLLTRSDPGTLFIHRNIANLLLPGEPAAEATVDFGVGTLGVRHLVVSGHTWCGGVEAALEGVTEGPVGRWIAPVRKLADEHRDELNAVRDHRDRIIRLAELNVVAQVENALRHPTVRARLEGSGPQLHLHGWIFRVESGLLDPLPLPADRWRAAGLLPADSAG